MAADNRTSIHYCTSVVVHVNVLPHPSPLYGFTNPRVRGECSVSEVTNHRYRYQYSTLLPVPVIVSILQYSRDTTGKLPTRPCSEASSMPHQGGFRFPHVRGAERLNHCLTLGLAPGLVFLLLPDFQHILGFLDLSFALPNLILVARRLGHRKLESAPAVLELCLRGL